MGTVILLRHGRSTANSRGVLAGRTPGVALDSRGQQQAADMVGRLASCRIGRIVTSPIDRCRQTVTPLARARGIEVETDERLLEVDYGSWTNRALTELMHLPLWRTVQATPSAAVFPGGEALADAAHRAARAARDLASSAGDGITVLCTHGDIIKAIVADALGMHLDLFQRIVVGPASISVVRYTAGGASVERVNVAGELDPVGAAEGHQGRVGQDAVVGGDTGGDTDGRETERPDEQEP